MFSRQNNGSSSSSNHHKSQCAKEREGGANEAAAARVQRKTRAYREGAKPTTARPPSSVGLRELPLACVCACVALVRRVRCSGGGDAHVLGELGDVGQERVEHVESELLGCQAVGGALVGVRLERLVHLVRSGSAVSGWLARGAVATSGLNGGGRAAAGG